MKVGTLYDDEDNTEWFCYFRDGNDRFYCVAVGYDDSAVFAKDGRHKGVHQFYLKPAKMKLVEIKAGEYVLHHLDKGVLTK